MALLFNRYRVELAVLTAVYSAILINVFQFQTLENLIGDTWPWLVGMAPFHNLGLPALGAFSALIVLVSTFGFAKSLRGALPRDLALNWAIGMSLVWMCVADWIHEGAKSSLADLGIFVYAASVFVGFRVLMTRDGALERIQIALMLAIFPVSVSGVLELFGLHFWEYYPGHSNEGVYAVSGFLQRKEIFAYVTGMGFLLSCLEISKPGGKMVFAMISLLLCGFGVYFAGSRSVLLALFVVMSASLLHAFANRRGRRAMPGQSRRLFIAIAVLSGALIMLAPFVHLGGDLSGYLLANDGGRLAMWERLLRQVPEISAAESLLYGMGKAAFAERVAIPAIGLSMISAHNTGLQLFVQYGLAGVALLLFTCFRFILCAYRQRTGVFLLWGYYLVVGLTSYLNAYPLVYMTLALLCAVSLPKKGAPANLATP